MLVDTDDVPNITIRGIGVPVESNRFGKQLFQMSVATIEIKGKLI
ncbi:hypothetical protein AB6F62_00585 [Providencia huaxiensis]